MSLDHALALLAEHLRPVVSQQTLPLEQAEGRILAKELIASLAHPPYDNSAVDGFAVGLPPESQDSPESYKIIGRAAAGHPFTGSLKQGEAIKIFTGASLPQGCEKIYMMEDSKLEGENRLIVPAGLNKGANMRFAGEDVAPNQPLLSIGKKLTPPDIALMAGQAMQQVTAYAPLKIAIFSTGDEVKAPSPDTNLQNGQLYDMNRPMLLSWCKRLGYAVTDLGILPDDHATIHEALLQAARHHHVILTSGGMSTGEEDHVRNVIEAIGTLHFWRLAIKPGRPIGMGLFQDAEHQCLFFGLPGNVVASFTTFAMVALPALRLLAGEQAKPPTLLNLTLTEPITKKAGRIEFIRAKRATDGVSVRPYGKAGAGILSSITGGDGFIMLEEAATKLEAGEQVDYIPFNHFYY